MGSGGANAEAQTRTAACALQDTQQVKPRKYKTTYKHQGKQLWIWTTTRTKQSIKNLLLE